MACNSRPHAPKDQVTGCERTQAEPSDTEKSIDQVLRVRLRLEDRLCAVAVVSLRITNLAKYLPMPSSSASLIPLISPDSAASIVKRLSGIPSASLSFSIASTLGLRDPFSINEIWLALSPARLASSCCCSPDTARAIRSAFP